MRSNGKREEAEMESSVVNIDTFRYSKIHKVILRELRRYFIAEDAKPLYGDLEVIRVDLNTGNLRHVSHILVSDECGVRGGNDEEWIGISFETVVDVINSTRNNDKGLFFETHEDVYTVGVLRHNAVYIVVWQDYLMKEGGSIEILNICVRMAKFLMNHEFG
jgi:hypothetical protein